MFLSFSDRFLTK